MPLDASRPLVTAAYAGRSVDDRCSVFNSALGGWPPRTGLMCALARHNRIARMPWTFERPYRELEFEHECKTDALPLEAVATLRLVAPHASIEVGLAFFVVQTRARRGADVFERSGRDPSA